ncbi:hypothetical protein L0F63_005573 [Massospora cicadina]|nr:hypothetical protein L0F63_005573 [Massospora cicadina]
MQAFNWESSSARLKIKPAKQFHFGGAKRSSIWKPGVLPHCGSCGQPPRLEVRVPEVVRKALQPLSKNLRTAVRLGFYFVNILVASKCRNVHQFAKQSSIRSVALEITMGLPVFGPAASVRGLVRFIPEKNNPPPEPDFAAMSHKKSWVGIAGIIIGVIFGLLGIVGMLILFWHRRRERRRRLRSDANLHSSHTTLYRPRSFIHAARSVVDNNAKELDAVAPLSTLPPTRGHP